MQLEKINCLRVCVNKPIKLRGAIFTRTKEIEFEIPLRARPQERGQKYA